MFFFLKYFFSFLFNNGFLWYSKVCFVSIVILEFNWWYVWVIFSVIIDEFIIIKCFGKLVVNSVFVEV